MIPSMIFGQTNFAWETFASLLSPDTLETTLCAKHPRGHHSFPILFLNQITSMYTYDDSITIEYDGEIAFH